VLMLFEGGLFVGRLVERRRAAEEAQSTPG
jgi:Sec-independent protein secretion pathway component TatC